MASADRDKLGADLSAYLDGELSQKRAREVEELLAESKEARRTLAELREVSEALGDLPRMRAPQELAERAHRGAERQVLLQKRPPERRARVLKLFGRISASAAVIAACAFAGWTVLQRGEQPASKTVERSLTHGKGSAVGSDDSRPLARGPSLPKSASPTDAKAEPPALAMGEQLDQLQALGYVGGSEQEEATPTTEADVALDTGITAGLGQTLEFAMATPPKDAPAVSIVVTPRNAEEFDAAVQTVALWQHPEGDNREAVVDRIETGGRRVARRSEFRLGIKTESTTNLPTQQDFTVEIPESQFGQFLTALDERAPGQVQAVVNFTPREMSQVQRMVMSAEAPPHPARPSATLGEPAAPEPTRAFARADVPSPESNLGAGEKGKFETGPVGGRAGGRGSVLRTPVDPDVAKLAQMEDAARSERLGGERAAGAPPGEHARKAAGYAAYSSGVRETDKERSAEKKKEQSDLRHPLVEEVAAKVPTRAATPTGTETRSRGGQSGPEHVGGPVAPAAGTPTFRDGLDELHKRVGDAYDALLDVALLRERRKEQPEPMAQTEPTAITLRVTVQPPPAVTTQPQAQP